MNETSPQPDSGFGIFFSKNSLVKAMVVSALLMGSIIFAGVSWNSGKYEKAYDTLDYKVENVDDPGLLEGVEYTSQVGQVGSKLSYIAEDGKVLHSEVVKEPVKEISARGSKSKTQAESEVRDLVNRCCKAWQDGDFSSMLGMVTTDSLQGCTLQDIEQAQAVCGDTLGPYRAGEITLYPVEEWSSYLSKQGDTMDDALSELPSLEGVGIVCKVALEITLRSDLHSDLGMKGPVFVVYSNGEWRSQYFGPLKAVSVGETKEVVKDSSYGGQKHWKVTLEKVVLHANRFTLLLSEENLADPVGNNIIDDYSQLRDIEIKISPKENLEKLRDGCTVLSYNIKRGSSQKSMMTYRPTLHSGNILYVSFADDGFTELTIP